MAIPADISQSFEEHLGGQVFSIAGTANPEVDVIVNALKYRS